MNTIKLHLIRESTMIAAAVSYFIYLNDNEIARLSNGCDTTLDAPANEKFYLTISTSGKKGSTFQKITPHMSMTMKKVLILPEYCKNGVVTCRIKTKMNLLGAVSFGILRPGSELEVNVNYD